MGSAAAVAVGDAEVVVPAVVAVVPVAGGELDWGVVVVLDAGGAAEESDGGEVDVPEGGGEESVVEDELFEW